MSTSTGGAKASSDWLLFIHADTALEPGWHEKVQTFIGDDSNLNRAAYFQFALNHDSPPAKRLEKIVSWRCRQFGLPYGDQGLLVHSSLYETIGGFRPLPLMEDVDLIRRLKKTVGGKACTVYKPER